MNYSKILESLQKASLFDLYRISEAIQVELENPQRQLEIKNQLRIGQTLEYFESTENRMVAATVLKIKRTRVLVRNRDNAECWDIPFYFINLAGTDAQIHSRKQGVDRHTLKVGDKVGFLDKQNQERYGTVARLNKKTVSVILNDGMKWRVAYSYLFPVIEGKQGQAWGDHILEGEVLKKDSSS